MSIKKFFLLCLCSIMAISCSTKEEIVYFDNAESLEGIENLLEYEPVIEENDVLRINVSSMNEEVVSPFQMNLGGQTSGGGGQNLSLTGYLVDVDGNIQFPILGKIPVAGKTRMEIETMLQTKIREYVTDAVVSVRIMNFRVTVLGEVRSPGRKDITDGRVSIPELIAMSGDITYNGKRENILVIREIEGVKQIGRVDMTSADVFKNPFYYLKQNDVVYVEPTYKQVKSAGFITSYTGVLSLFTSALSLYLLFSR
ncbi:MAG TPA: polysaccharide biosynthesis/export family protein [Salinimicrobium sp.]|nr:polysaccharide biosynthesis/export family protein [Salinimicrobium sp.]